MFWINISIQRQIRTSDNKLQHSVHVFPEVTNDLKMDTSNNMDFRTDEQIDIQRPAVYVEILCKNPV